jgi:hypothetical protein
VTIAALSPFLFGLVLLPAVCLAALPRRAGGVRAAASFPQRHLASATFADGGMCQTSLTLSPVIRRRATRSDAMKK